MKINVIVVCLLFLCTFQIEAKRFTSQYCEFELPNGWECALEGTEWVCQSTNKQRRKEAIIILAAKIRGKQDDLAQYQAYLKKPKTFGLPDGKTQVSDPKYVKKNSVNGHNWVDALHLASEVPGFYTRYMATVKEDLGVAVTFSVAKDHYDDYQVIFDRIIATMRVFRQKSTKASDFVAKKQNENLVDGVFDAGLDTDANQYNIGARKKGKAGSGGTSTDDLLLYGLIAAVAGFAFFKMKSGKKGKGTKKKKKKS
jgi:hypothetical protein